MGQWVEWLDEGMNGWVRVHAYIHMYNTHAQIYV